MSSATIQNLCDVTKQFQPAVKPAAANLPPLIFMADRDYTEDLVATIAKLPAEILVIYRDYEQDDREEMAEAITTLCALSGRPLFIGKDPALADHVNAAGVHFPEGCIDNIPACIKRHPDLSITAAAHSLPALKKASQAGTHAALCSPIFPTATHPEYTDADCIGPDTLQTWAHAVPIPIYALGGVNAGNVSELVTTGVYGVAGISVFGE